MNWHVDNLVNELVDLVNEWHSRVPSPIAVGLTVNMCCSIRVQPHEVMVIDSLSQINARGVALAPLQSIRSTLGGV